jgi:hypothetical protein
LRINSNASTPGAGLDRQALVVLEICPAAAALARRPAEVAQAQFFEHAVFKKFNVFSVTCVLPSGPSPHL